ncbi:MAG: DNA mismatch repair protein MutS, partial [Gluconacetobacter diazotrophicus]|nr:DNA mismatch repair protein MutS [Gluconacetobacter diazotrophicus]
MPRRLLAESDTLLWLDAMRDARPLRGRTAPARPPEPAPTVAGGPPA